MVNPINPGLAATYGMPPAEAERPVAALEPAIRVPAANQNQGSSSATDGNKPHQDGQPDDAVPLEDVLKTLNNDLKAWSTGMRFEVDKDAQRVVVSIIDNETGEVLRTVPSDAVIRMARTIVQLQGNSIDTKV